MEIDEFKKFKIKAHPVSQKVLQGPIKPISIAKKPATIIKPFNLSEGHKKKVEEEAPEHYEFHARPMPKTIYEVPFSEMKIVCNKSNLRLLHPKEKQKIECVKSASVEKLFKPTRTEPLPFSFDARDQELAKRHEEKVQKILEEEKKVREFQAKPLPKYISKKSQSLSSLKAIKIENQTQDPPTVFKAKFPAVLYQRPFEPKKSDRGIVAEFAEFSLYSDRRAKDREEFEKKKQEKMERMAVEKMIRKEMLSRSEEEELAILRKETVHMAQPIRRYKELKIEPSGKLTVPVTPKFKTSNRVNGQNKENSKNLGNAIFK